MDRKSKIVRRSAPMTIGFPFTENPSEIKICFEILLTFIIVSQFLMVTLNSVPDARRSAAPGIF